MMYIWESKFLEQWGPGHIVISADNIKDAQMIARSRFQGYMRERYDWFYTFTHNNNPDEDDEIEEYKEEIEEKTSIFEEDITKQPKILDCLFLSGSQ